MLIIYLFLDKYLRSKIIGSQGLNKVFDIFTKLAFQQNVPISMLASEIHFTVSFPVLDIIIFHLISETEFNLKLAFLSLLILLNILKYLLSFFISSSIMFTCFAHFPIRMFMSYWQEDHSIYGVSSTFYLPYIANIFPCGSWPFNYIYCAITLFMV